MQDQPTLKQLLTRDRILVAPCCYDMISARLIERAGFEAVYLGGYAHVASHVGLPDAGLATFSEMLERVHNLVRCVGIPVLADGDTGYGNALNMRRTVQEYEQAGAQAIQIEDQEMPKKCGHTPGKRLIGAEEMALKVEAAAHSRRSDDFLIVARTDAIAVMGLEEAVKRGQLYEKAGADVVFLEAPTTLEELKAAAGSFGVHDDGQPDRGREDALPLDGRAPGAGVQDRRLSALADPRLHPVDPEDAQGLEGTGDDAGGRRGDGGLRGAGRADRVSRGAGLGGEVHAQGGADPAFWSVPAAPAAPWRRVRRAWVGGSIA